jgi:hypothetical protein
MSNTQQVNLRLPPKHAKLVRLFVQRLREGGPSYEREANVFLLERYKPHYMTIPELDRRFGEILRRIEALEAELSGPASQGGLSAVSVQSKSVLTETKTER